MALTNHLYETIFDNNQLDTEKLSSLYGMLPAHVYFIDERRKHVWANEMFRRDILALSDIDVIGKTNFEFLIESDAIVATDIEDAIFSGKQNETYKRYFPSNDDVPQKHAYEEWLKLGNGELICGQSSKVSVHDPDGKPLGIFGVTVALDLEAKKYALIGRLKNGGFSKQQSLCMYHLIHGCTAQMIAETLNLSRRTIEFYIANMKKKFDCKSTSELIASVVEQYLV